MIVSALVTWGVLARALLRARASCVRCDHLRRGRGGELLQFQGVRCWLAWLVCRWGVQRVLSAGFSVEPNGRWWQLAVAGRGRPLLCVSALHRRSIGACPHPLQAEAKSMLNVR